MAAKFDRAENVGEDFSGGYADLGFHQVNAGDHFGYRVLDLDAGVHFDEVEFAGFFAQKFDGAGAGIAELFQRFHDLVAHAFARGCVNDGEDGDSSRSFLVAALEGTFAFAQVDYVAVLVAKDLKLDVARVLD